ncbi:MAG: OmpA family protein [Bacteroidota bacterium]
MIFGMLGVLAQSKRSKGDGFFFQYKYEKAVAAYEAERDKGGLNNQQQLNLADSYFKTGSFDNASKLYLEILEKDTIMTGNHYNMMLQSLSRLNRSLPLDSLKSKSEDFQVELLENAEFNTSLLENEANIPGVEYTIFNAATNTPQSDFSPSFYEDTSVLFSSGRTEDKKNVYEPAGEGYLNIFKAQITTGSQLQAARIYSGIAPTKYHKATPQYAPSLDAVFYVTSNTKEGELLFDTNGKNTLAIAKQDKKKNQLLFRDISTSFYYPFYEEKTGRLYFAAKFEDSYGGTDLYYVSTNAGMVMSAPVNLGPQVNTPGNEIAPFIFENSLYFSSDVFYGLGGMDIYKSDMEAEGAFSIPVNLGSVINSEKDDFGFIVRNEGDGLLGYFSSNRDGGKGKDDIYGFKVAEKPGLKTIIFKGTISKSNGYANYVDGATIQLKDTNGRTLRSVSSELNGDYRIEIPWQKGVTLAVSKPRFSQYSRSFSETELDSLTQDIWDFNIDAYDDLVEVQEEQKVIKLQKFFFGRGITSLDDTIKAELDKVVAFVKGFPNAQLRIESHTDSRGGSSTNFRLTQKRSDAMKAYLIAQGVPEANILYSMGFGENKILNNCRNGVYCLEMLHRQNQRTLFVVLNDNVLFE